MAILVRCLVQQLWETGTMIMLTHRPQKKRSFDTCINPISFSRVLIFLKNHAYTCVQLTTETWYALVIDIFIFSDREQETWSYSAACSGNLLAFLSFISLGIYLFRPLHLAIFPFFKINILFSKVFINQLEDLFPLVLVHAILRDKGWKAFHAIALVILTWDSTGQYDLARGICAVWKWWNPL